MQGPSAKDGGVCRLTIEMQTGDVITLEGEDFLLE
jgi:hypothetical protein